MTRLFTDRIALFFNKLEADHPKQHHLLWSVYPEAARQILDISERDIKALINKSTGFLAIADELIRENG